MEASNELLNIFNESQQSKRSHKTHSKKLAAMLNGPNKDQLKKVLLKGILDQSLLYPKSDPMCMRVLEFFSLLMVTVDVATLQAVVEHLFSRLKSTVKVVRQKVCNVFEGFLRNSASEQLEISCELLSEIATHVTERLKDKIPTVRLAAVNVLFFLQDADDENDPVVDALLHAFETDATAAVRKSIAQQIALHENKIKPALLRRLKDVSADVRATIYERFSEDTDIRQFTKESRVDILVGGLTDRDKTVVAAAEKLLMRWYELLQKDLVKFLNYFGPTENEEALYLIASVLSEKLSAVQDAQNEIEQDLPIQYERVESMNIALFIWLYVRCGYISQFSNKFNLIKFSEAFLPTPEEFEAALSSLTIYNDHKNQVYIKYLLLLVPYISLSTDITGHKLLQEATLNAMSAAAAQGFEEGVVTAACKALGHLDSEISTGPRAASLVFDIVQTTLSKVSEEDGQNGILMVSSALQWLLQQQSQQRKKGKTSSLLPVQELVPAVMQCVQQTDAVLRGSAIAALGMLAMYDEVTRAQYLGLLRQIAFGNFEDAQIRVMAMQAVVDNMLINPEDAVVEEHKNAIQSNLATAIGQVNPVIWSAFVEGAAKLVFGGISSDPYLVSKLLYTFFVGIKGEDNDDDADDLLENGGSASFQRVQQLLSVLFSAYVAKNDASFETLRESLSLLVSDLSMAVRDQLISTSVFVQSFQKLFGICDRVYEELSKKTQQEAAQQKMLVSFASLKMTAFACIARELLKLDVSSKSDKTMAKDFVRALSYINGSAWLPACQVSLFRITTRHFPL